MCWKNSLISIYQNLRNLVDNKKSFLPDNIFSNVRREHIQLKAEQTLKKSTADQEKIT